MKLKIFQPKTKSYFLLRELYVLIKGGISLPKALELLALQKKDVSQELLKIKKSIEEGESLPEAFKQSGLFPDFVCEMLVAAQTGGSLEEIFLKSSEWLSRMEEFKSRIANSLIYPSIVISLSLVALIIVLEFIVPKLRKILLSFGYDLPFFSKVLVWGATCMWWGLLLGIPVILVFGYFWIKKKGWATLHRLLLRIPLVGRLWIYFDLSRWSYTTALLLSAGIVLPRAVAIGAETCQNLYLQKKLSKLALPLEEGEPLSYHLKKISSIPLFLSELVVVGEETGTLSEMLQNASDFFIKEAEDLINTILKWIEPLSILILGSIVAYIIISVILPIMKISTAVRLS